MKLCPSCQQCYEDNFTRCTDDQAVLLPSRPGTRLVAHKYSLDRLLSLSDSDTEASYVGTHLETERPVSITLLLPPPAADAETSKHLRREAHAVAHLNTRIDHQHVAKTYDYGLLTDGTPYIVTELVPGQSLRAYLKSVGHVPLAAAVRISRQVADGLGAAHNCGVVHRALEPSNIILGRDYYGRLEAKIINFGFAKLGESPAPAHGGGNGNKAEMCAATATLSAWSPYRAPEQYAGHNADQRSDFYSLGVMLYEMLNGCLSGPASEVNTSENGATGLGAGAEWPELNGLNTDVPESLIRLIRQLVQRKAAARPSSAVEIARQLRQVEQAMGQPRAVAPYESDAPVRPTVAPPAVVKAQVFSVGDAAASPPPAVIAAGGSRSPEETCELPPRTETSRGEAAVVAKEIQVGKETAALSSAAGSNSGGGNNNGGRRKIKSVIDEIPPARYVEDGTPVGADDLGVEDQMFAPATTRPPQIVARPIGRAHQRVHASAIVGIVLALTIGSGVWLALRGVSALPRALRSDPADSLPENTRRIEGTTAATGKDGNSHAASGGGLERGAGAEPATAAAKALEESETMPEAKTEADPSRATREQKDDSVPKGSADANPKTPDAKETAAVPPLKQRSDAPSSSQMATVKSPPGRKSPGKCSISTSESALTISSNGGSSTIAVGLDGWSGPAQVSATTASWSDIVVFSDPQARQSDGPVKYSVVSVSKKAGPYNVIFRSPCGSKTIPITVK